jgi:hypothetical protein
MVFLPHWRVLAASGFRRIDTALQQGDALQMLTLHSTVFRLQEVFSN